MLAVCKGRKRAHSADGTECKPENFATVDSDEAEAVAYAAFATVDSDEAEAVAYAAFRAKRACIKSLKAKRQAESDAKDAHIALFTGTFARDISVTHPDNRAPVYAKEVRARDEMVSYLSDGKYTSSVLAHLNAQHSWFNDKKVAEKVPVPYVNTEHDTSRVGGDEVVNTFYDQFIVRGNLTKYFMSQDFTNTQYAVEMLMLVPNLASKPNGDQYDTAKQLWCERHLATMQMSAMTRQGVHDRSVAVSLILSLLPYLKDFNSLVVAYAVEAEFTGL